MGCTGVYGLMTISYVTSASSGFTTSLKSGYVDTANNYYLTTNGTTGLFKRFNMATGAQVGSDVSIVTTNVACCLINSASAFIASTAGTAHQFIQLSSGYVQTVSSGSSAGAAISKNDPGGSHQIIAVDETNQIAIFLGSTNANLVKVTSAQAYTVLTNFAGYSPPNTALTCIIFKGNRRWLVGNSVGRIFEIDDLGNVYNEITVFPSPHFSTTPTTTQTPNFTIWSMAYGDNLLLVSTTVGLFLYDYTTNTLIGQNGSIITSTISIFLSEMYQGVVLASRNGQTQSYGKTVYELECNSNGLNIKGKCFMFASNFAIRPTNDIHINTTNGNAVMAASDGGFQYIAFMGVTPRGSTTRTINVSPGGVHQRFRLLAIDDTLGQGNRTILFDTFAQSPYTYRVPTGKSIIELVKVGQGTDATWGLGRYST